MGVFIKPWRYSVVKERVSYPSPVKSRGSSPLGNGDPIRITKSSGDKGIYGLLLRLVLCFLQMLPDSLTGDVFHDNACRIALSASVENPRRPRRRA